MTRAASGDAAQTGRPGENAKLEEGVSLQGPSFSILSKTVQKELFNFNVD